MNVNISEFRFPTALTVSEINSFIKDLLDETPPLKDVYVKGEISNFKPHSSGHYYFSLKDSESSLKSVMFRSDAASLAFMPENGMTVIARGRISSFVRDGAYQLYVKEMQPDGVGSMYIALEQLKKKLETMGLTSDSRKRPIPKIPLKIGVVTSPTGAAVRDIINVTKRRFPLAELFVYPALVQGEGAPASIVNGIEYFNSRNDIDVLIVGRGGGSVEDLWAFNSESVAMAVANSNIPIISAVGHETDISVCDMVADLRAPTPSAAAEVCVPNTVELKQKFNNLSFKLKDLLLSIISEHRHTLDIIKNSRVLQSPRNSIDDKRMVVVSYYDLLEKLVSNQLVNKKAILENSASTLNALSPLNVFDRGYSASMLGDKIVSSVNEVEVNDTISVIFKDGTVSAKVTEKGNITVYDRK